MIIGKYVTENYSLLTGGNCLKLTAKQEFDISTQGIFWMLKGGVGGGA